MSWYNAILEKIKTESCYIERAYYEKEKAIVYSFIINETDGTKCIFCELAGNLAYKLKRETNINIVEKKCTALNFTPVPVPFNCIRH